MPSGGRVWDRPGPHPPGPRGDPDLVPGPGETLDYLSGHWRIFQLKRGHRYSTDDLLTAWFAWHTLADAGRLPRHHLDLGCGTGSVGLLISWKCPESRWVGIEVQDVSARLAERTVRYNGIEGRAEIRPGDLRSPGVLGPDEQFDLVTASPPYLTPGEGRRSDEPQRGPCRFEERGGVEDYLRVAAGHLKPEGTIVWVHATRYAEANRRAAITVGIPWVESREVVFREGKPSLISLFRGGLLPAEGAQGAPPPLVVRRLDGSWSREYREIRGQMGFPA